MKSAKAEAATTPAKAEPGDTATKLLVCFTGIFSCFCTLSYVTEWLFSGRYGPDQERFTDRQFLLVPTCVCNVAISLGLMVWESGRQSSDDKPLVPLIQKRVMSLSTLLSSCCQNGGAMVSFYAVDFLTYPTYHLAKCMSVWAVPPPHPEVEGKPKRAAT
eukprot:gene7534-7043_t